MPRAARRQIEAGQVWQDRDSRVVSRLVEVVTAPEDQNDNDGYLYVRRGIGAGQATRLTRLLVRNLRQRYVFIAPSVAEMPQAQ